MEDNNAKINISDELLESLSMEELVDLKVEVDDLVERLDRVIADCDEAINS